MLAFSNAFIHFMRIEPHAPLGFAENCMLYLFCIQGYEMCWPLPVFSTWSLTLAEPGYCLFTDWPLEVMHLL